MDEILSLLSTYVLPHWPFLVVMGILSVLGQFMSKSVFTRKRAYEKRSSPWYKFWGTQSFWWWGRETLPLHPIATGALLGLAWRNPEGLEWGLLGSSGYFAGAGVVSLFAWAFARAYFKKKGIRLELPGSSGEGAE